MKFRGRQEIAGPCLCDETQRSGARVCGLAGDQLAAVSGMAATRPISAVQTTSPFFLKADGPPTSYIWTIRSPAPACVLTRWRRRHPGGQAVRLDADEAAGHRCDLAQTPKPVACAGSQVLSLPAARLAATWPNQVWASRAEPVKRPVDYRTVISAAKAPSADSASCPGQNTRSLNILRLVMIRKPPKA